MPEEKKGHLRFLKNPLFWLALIILVGGFLRTYHFSDWLHFELDQSRDARVVNDAYAENGGNILDLPLLGPRAAGTYLRLGPGFYYMEYLSSVIFGKDIVGMVAFIPLLSILAIPLIYLFLRRGFPRTISLALTALSAVSVFLVVYARFGWNPNPLPFFLILGFYALLRSADADERRKSLWFALSAFSLALATQLHFVAFMGLPVIVAVFLAFVRPRIPWKGWVAAFSLILFLYVPVIINDIEAQGANSKEFIQAVFGKSEGGDRTPLSKLYEMLPANSFGHALVLTGDGELDLPSLRTRGPGFSFSCDERCHSVMEESVGMAVLFVLSVLALLYRTWKESPGPRRNFFILASVWLFVSFTLFFPVVYDLAPRFFLFTAPLSFVLAGAFLVESTRLFGKYRIFRIAFWAAIAAIASLNLFYAYQRADEIDRSMTESVRSPKDRILKEKVRVPLALQYRIVDFMQDESERTGYPVYMRSEPEYRRALKYHMDLRGMENGVLGLGSIYRQGLYYLIIRNDSDHEDAVDKYLLQYDLARKVRFGTLTLIEFVPKPESIQAEREVFDKTDVKENTKKAPRYTWREILERRQENFVEDTDE